MVILPRSTDAVVPCTLVTAGIGNDVMAELRLKQHLPHCQFIGIDPIASSGALYGQVGRYHQTAVAARPGVLNASVNVNATYVYQRIAVTSLASFLMAETPTGTVVDYLWMDIEGPEYSLLAQLSKNGPLANARVICQINVELHGPLDDYDVSAAKFYFVMKQLMVETNFVPIYLTRPIHHQRLTLINWFDKECVDRYVYRICA